MSSIPDGSVLIIFAKSPSSGDVKTRLSPVLSLPEREALHVAFLRDTIEKACSTNLPVRLYLTTPAPLPFPCPLPLKVQTGTDLGMRMLQAFQDECRSYAKVVIIGTDSPTFCPEEAFGALSALDHSDVVIGPCEDGGYYLIAMKEPVREAFHEIPWGTGDVLAASLRALKHHRVHLLRSSFDVDRPEDLIRLRKEVHSSRVPYLRHTRDWFQKRSHPDESAFCPPGS